MRTRLLPTLSRNRRGSVLILVVAVLAVLVMLTLTLGYMSRMDLLASRNWGNTVQSRMAAVTGVPDFNNEQPTSKTALATAPSVTQAAQPGQIDNGNLTAQAILNRGYATQRPFTLDIALGQVSTAFQTAGGARSGQDSQTMAAMGQAGPARRSRAMAGAAGGSTAATGQGTTGGSTQNGDALSDTDASADASAELATSQVEDESAKININAVTPDALVAAGGGEQSFSAQGTTLPAAAGTVTESALVRLIQQAAAANRISVDGAQALAHAILLRRYGPDGLPGDNGYATTTVQASTPSGSLAQSGVTSQTADAPGKASSDPRRKPTGDDHLYTSLQELLGLPGMTPALYKALTPYLTVFSVSLAAFQTDSGSDRQGASGHRGSRGGDAGRQRQAPAGDSASPQDEAPDSATDAGWRAASKGAATGLPQIDPNTATPDVLYAALAQRFPDVDEDLLGQFVANLIDRRDADSVPTTIQINSRTYTGIEINPCINEICPDPSATGNQGGQFIEIYNPWSKSISLSGWSLRGTGIQARLNTTLPSGGLLVLTNNINNDSNPTAEDNGLDGSFYNVFKKVATGDTHQLVEVQGMSLPADSGRVQLVNPDGLVVDEFEYAGGRNTGAAYSFQRLDPRLRVARRLLPPTPLEANQGATMTTEWAQALQVMEQSQNQPFHSPLDVMLVSTAYAASAGNRNFADPEEHRGHRGQGGDNSGSGQAQEGGRGGAGRFGMAQPGARPEDKQVKSWDRAQDGSGGQPQGHPFALPVLSDDTDENLDVRLVDCFRNGAQLVAQGDPVIPGTPATAGGTLDDAAAQQLAAAQAATAAGQSGAQLVRLPQGPACETIRGRLNLNTAPVAVISTLPGMDSRLLIRIAQQRSGLSGSLDVYGVATSPANTSQAWTAWDAESPFGMTRWSNLSDFLRDETLWEGRPLYDRLDAVYPFSQMVAFHSLAVRVTTASIPAPSASNPGTQSQAGANQAAKASTAGTPQKSRQMITSGRIRQGVALATRMRSAQAAGNTAASAQNQQPLAPGTRRTYIMQTERIIATDRGTPETVLFRYIGNYSENQTDPDLRFAQQQAGNVQALDVNALAAKVRAGGGKTVAPAATTPAAGSVSRY